MQHDVGLAARPQHSHPHPHLPHGGCEARLTRRRAAMHVSMWCIAVWCCAVVLHGDSKPETRPSAPSSITHRPCHPATLPIPRGNSRPTAAAGRSEREKGLLQLGATFCAWPSAPCQRNDQNKSSCAVQPLSRCSSLPVRPVAGPVYTPALASDAC